MGPASRTSAKLKASKMNKTRAQKIVWHRLARQTCRKRLHRPEEGAGEISFFFVFQFFGNSLNPFFILVPIKFVPYLFFMPEVFWLGILTQITPTECR